MSKHAASGTLADAVRWLFLLAYTCSGLAGLVYEVSWTRYLTLYIGQTTAAAATVVGAFLGGLAVGAAWGGAVAARLEPHRSLRLYIGLELTVIAGAFLLPFEPGVLTPLLKWAYADGTSGAVFPAVRVVTALVMVLIPAVALGATFPVAVRWFAERTASAARASGALYAANTSGAAVGAVLAGFILVPAIGVSGTMRIGMAATAAAVLGVWLVAMRSARIPEPARPAVRPRWARAARHQAEEAQARRRPWLAALVVALTGFAGLVHEIAWTRILALVFGPTTYAFAATVAAVVAGVAGGSAIGSWIAGRSRRPIGWLAIALAGAAVAASWTGVLAGSDVPSRVAREMASAPDAFQLLVRQGTLLTALLIVPTALCLGASFPLVLSIVGAPSDAAARPFGFVYAFNTVGAVAGSLAAGFFLIPRFGLQTTIAIVGGCLIAAAVIVVVWGDLTRPAAVLGMITAFLAAAILSMSPPWDRALLASGPYLYAPFVPKGLDLDALLEAGDLLYYRDGASATVSVKRLTGTTTLAVDGKVDASDRSDMLTQKLLAHLPLLIHDQPREVAIIGLGSGVTAGAALAHPITHADVVEISPEVVQASKYFDAVNGRPLDDPRTHLIIGDGRAHLLLSGRQYDVIISEPSNPWIAGVAALFSREFFEAARDRLAPGGIICQWAHTYNISDYDLRSIVATFTSVFPDGTLWLVGQDDILLVASDGPLDARLANIARHWDRPGVAEDLASVSAFEPYSVLSLYAGGPAELARYAAGGEVLTDDRMRLEFSGPRQLHTEDAPGNSATLAGLAEPDRAPAAVRSARAAAGSVELRQRAAMLFGADAYGPAYDDYLRALRLDPADRSALDGLTRTAILTGRVPDALGWLGALTVDRSPSAALLIARSKLLAASGDHANALRAARQATQAAPGASDPLEQLASLYAAVNDITALDATVTDLRRVSPARAPTEYYAAVSAFLQGRFEQSVALGERASAADATFAPVHDLMGAAYTKLGKTAEARRAFDASLHVDAHDSTAYTNLGLIELAAGNRPAAVNLFAEALWLAPDSKTAREGLARAK